jgi:hypothetical protein
MKKLILIAVAAITAAIAPIAVASASSFNTSQKTVSLNGGQSVSVTCSGKSISVTKSGNIAVLACASRPAKASVTVPPKPAKTGGNGSSPSSPIAFGQSGSVDGWTVKVISLTSSPTNGADEPPPAGYAFMVYTLQTTRTDSKPDAPILLTPKLLGPSKAERSSITSPICLGGTPYNDQVLQGGTVMTGGCISVKSSDVGHLVIGVGFIHQTWFATQ